MKLNDRYIKATLAGIPYLLPYGQLIADPAPATRLNDSGSLLWDGILEGDSREELLALLADRYHATERERAALAEDVDQYLHSLCRMGILLADTPEIRGDDTPPLFYRIGPLVFSYRGPSLLYDRFFSAFSCEEEDFDQEVLILTGKLIYHLVKERGMTLEGAKKALKQKPAAEGGVQRDAELMERLQRIRALLAEVREDLKVGEGEILAGADAEVPAAEAGATVPRRKAKPVVP